MTPSNENFDDKAKELDMLLSEDEVTVDTKKSLLDPITSVLKAKLHSILDFKHLEFTGNPITNSTSMHLDPNLSISRILMGVEQDLDEELANEVVLTAMAPQKLIHDICHRLRANAEFRKIGLSYEINDLQQKVMMNAQMVTKILSCLIDNSINNCDAGSKIKISAEKLDNENFKICVLDTGFGLSNEKLDALKQSIQQKNKEMTSLYSAYQIMQLHGGNLTIASEQYQSCEVQLIFKCA